MSNQIIEMIKTAIQLDQPIMLWGAPGVGKSDMVFQAGEELGLPVIDVRLPLLEPTDLRGLPHVVDGEATWSRPDFLPLIGSDLPENCIVFLDEMTAADISTQKAALQPMIKVNGMRCIGEHVFKKGVVFVAAGNRRQDRTGSNAMITALANRFVHVDVEPDVKNWATWAMNNEVHPYAVACVKFRPDLMHEMPQPGQNAFPTPRSWATLGKALPQLTGEMRFRFAAACIGDSAAAEFRSFVMMAEELPSISEILSRPDEAKIPENIDSKTALLYALSVGISNAVDADTFENGIAYMQRIGHDEFVTLTAFDAVRRDPDLRHTRAFSDIALKTSEAFVG